MLCFWSKPSSPPPHGNSFDKEQGGAVGGGWSQQPLSPHQRKCAWAGGVGGKWGLFPVPADWVLVLARRADRRGPQPQVGPSVGFGVAAAAASSSGEPQTFRRSCRQKHWDH